ncbi:alkaline serine exoprotease A precursor [Myxococcus stipitatus DSM 14675]|uniref:Alkaline serine exoprotease A n=1 Tax=Myxococcus stipitatus (strain DSM 14675 / JCM 12634 / Mx s8) TaxID=1278073 RepID=L7UFH6_MYXSD|nr:S8 family serine peptidase [Myxococcus stipitatus]AGC47696.1 alkaline serine exoprotease A precursor [Myxococcus stipitatus DSM 14675]
MRPHLSLAHRARAVAFRTLSLLGALALGGSACGERPSSGEPAAAAVDTVKLARLTRAPESLRVPGEYVVVFAQGLSGGALTAAADTITRAGGTNTLLHRYSLIPGFTARLDDAQLDRLRRDPGVAYIEENQHVFLKSAVPSPSDGIDRVDQRQGRDGQYNDYENTGAGVHVYVLDTGLNTEHSEFTGRVGSSESFVFDGFGVEDCHGHGTHVASTAVGTQYGMAKQATLHPVRILNCIGRATWGTIIAGLEFVRMDCPRQDGPCVANLSLSGEFFQPVNQAAAALVDAGIPVVVAAGNSNIDACLESPGSEPKVINVGAVDDNDKRALFSNWGTCVDLFAPGVSILGAWAGDAVATNIDDGTSMAAPHVTGAVAQYLESHRTATPAQVTVNLKGAATLGCVDDLMGSPNSLLFSDLSQGNYLCVADPNSCKGLCGGAATGCFCDPTCLEFNDCCPDFQQVCQ